MYRTVVTICTGSLTFSNSTFCPHSVFMCFVWIWEQTAIISCAVRALFLYIYIYMYICLSLSLYIYIYTYIYLTSLVLDPIIALTASLLQHLNHTLHFIDSHYEHLTFVHVLTLNLWQVAHINFYIPFKQRTSCWWIWLAEYINKMSSGNKSRKQITFNWPSTFRIIQDTVQGKAFTDTLYLFRKILLRI